MVLVGGVCAVGIPVVVVVVMGGGDDDKVVRVVGEGVVGVVGVVIGKLLTVV